jgi:FlaA1/EpsC-like NDP-sugar epimerase
LYTFFFWHARGSDLSRSFALIFMPVSLLGLMAANYALVLVIAAAGGRLMGEERILVAGEGDCAREVIRNISSGSGGYAKIIGLIVPERATDVPASAACTVRGTVSQLAEVINRERVDRLVIANGSLSHTEFDQCVQVSRRMGVTASHAIGNPYDGFRYGFRVMYGMPLLEMQPAAFTRSCEAAKRLFDLACACTALIAVCCAS